MFEVLPRARRYAVFFVWIILFNLQNNPGKEVFPFPLYR